MGTGIAGFGIYNYKYESGQKETAPLAGLSPRANAITLYLSNAKAKEDLLKKSGRHKTGGGCIYIQNPENINTGILTQMVDNSIKHLRSIYPD